MKKLLTILLFTPIFLIAQNDPPQITITDIEVDEANKTLTILYDLQDTENDDVEISFRASNDGDSYFNVNTSSASGDLGFPINPGTDKQIFWDYTSIPDLAQSIEIKITADDRYEVDRQSIIDQVNKDSLRNNLELIEGPRHFNANFTNLNQTRELIENTFTTSGLNTYRQLFPYQEISGQNIIGEHLGTTSDTEIFIVDAHYDTVETSPGADDNGSGVVGFLEAARILSQYTFKKTIRFIGFDNEEQGLVGSSYHVNQLTDEENVNGVFNFEMIGYYDDTPDTQVLPAGFDIFFPEIAQNVANNENRGDFITSIVIENSTHLSDAFIQAQQNYVNDLSVEHLLVSNELIPLVPDLLRSDHAPFWANGIPALLITDTANFRNPNYHSPNDKVSTLDFDFMALVVKATIGAILELAEITHSTEETASVQLSTSSVKDDQLGCDFSLSPVPTKDRLSVTFESCELHDFSFDLIDIQGRKLLSYNVKSYENQFSIDLSEFQSGIYFVRISDSNRFSTKKIQIIR